LRDIILHVDKTETVLRDPSINKGHLVHGFTMSMVMIKKAATNNNQSPSFTEAMAFVMSFENSDTDTNACIVGSIVGAMLGWTKMCTESDVNYNWPVIVASTSDDSKTQVRRTKQYQLGDLAVLEQELFKLASLSPPAIAASVKSKSLLFK
jgi:hypothetical protein